jgi:hypothetical protein
VSDEHREHAQEEKPNRRGPRLGSKQQARQDADRDDVAEQEGDLDRANGLRQPGLREQRIGESDPDEQGDARGKNASVEEHGPARTERSPDDQQGKSEGHDRVADQMDCVCDVCQRRGRERLRHR